MQDKVLKFLNYFENIFYEAEIKRFKMWIRGQKKDYPLQSSLFLLSLSILSTN